MIFCPCEGNWNNGKSKYETLLELIDKKCALKILYPCSYLSIRGCHSSMYKHRLHLTPAASRPPF